MSISKRQEQILEILNERTFVTVNDLSKLTFTSPSSIRRDLTYLQHNGLVERTHGGVSTPNPIKGVASFYDRARKNMKAKRIVAQKASPLLRDGQNILLDSSSTVQYLLPYIAKKNGVSVFTNNLSTAIQSIELGINTHCLGGRALNGSVVLTGADTYRSLANLNADIVFFSSQSLNINGEITDSTQEENYATMLMLQSAKTSVFLCDSEKFNTTSVHKLCNLNDIDFAVFDEHYDELITSCSLLS